MSGVDRRTFIKRSAAGVAGAAAIGALGAGPAAAATGWRPRRGGHRAGERVGRCGGRHIRPGTRQVRVMVGSRGRPPRCRLGASHPRAEEPDGASRLTASELHSPTIEQGGSTCHHREAPASRRTPWPTTPTCTRSSAPTIRRPSPSSPTSSRSVSAGGPNFFEFGDDVTYAIHQ
jgi:hypothetical protein